MGGKRRERFLRHDSRIFCGGSTLVNTPIGMSGVHTWIAFPLAQEIYYAHLVPY